MTSINGGLYHDSNSALVVKVHEERIDCHNCTEFKKDVIELLDKGTKILIFDIDEVRFIDSSGVGALLGIYKHTKITDAEFILVNLQPRVYTRFALDRLTRFFNIFPSLEDAMDTLANISQQAGKQD